MAKQRGVVKFYKPDVRWGFIINDYREEVFLHHTKIVDKKYVPKKDDVVMFEQQKTDKGLVAVDVEKI